jgi:hypothetical protein
LPGTNANLVQTLIKSFITLSPVFVPGKPFQPSLMFVGEVRSLPKAEHLRDASLG